MKLCYVASPSIHTDRWLQYFSDCGHEIHLITSVDDYRSGVRGVTTHHIKRTVSQGRIANMAMNIIPMISQLRGFVREIKPDILHAHYIGDTSALAASIDFHPFVVTAWGSDVLVEPAQSAVSKLILKYVLAKADVVTCDGGKIADALRQMTDPSKVSVIYHGADCLMFHPSRHKVPQTVISTRSLEPVYDVDTVVRSMPEVLSQCPEAWFAIVGDGSQRSRLEQDVARMKSRYSFMGRLSPKALSEVLSEATVYVSTSLSDTTSVSLLEAMACGLPVVVTDVGENRFWVKDGINGFVVSSGCHEALSDKVIFLLHHPDVCAAMGKVNRETIVNCANLHKEMAKMGEIYERCL